MNNYFAKFIKDKKYIKLLLVMAIPIALQNLLSALLNVVDGIMVSSLSNSDAKMAAVLICNQIIFVFSVIIFAISSICSVFASQYYGKKDLTNVPKCVGIALTVSLGLAVLFTLGTFVFARQILSLFSHDSLVIDYGTEFMRIVCFSFIPFAASTVFGVSLRGIRKIAVGFYVLVSGVLFNSFFNVVFMYGKLGFPNLDLAGAAVGTVIARSLELVLVVIICLAKKYPVIASPKKMFGYSRSLFGKMLKFMLPAIGNEVFWVLGTTCFLVIFGQVDNSTAVQAAINITSNIDRLVYVFLIGIGVSTAIVVGNELGAMEMEKARESGEKSLVFAFLVGIACAIVMSLFIFLIPLIYTNASNETINIAKKLLIIFACSMLIKSLNFTLIIGILRGGGDTKFAFFTETITIWCVAVPFCIISALVLKLPPEIVYIFIFSEELVKFFIVMKRFKSNRWQRNIVN